MRVLLLSTYELGHQPLGLARPAADLLAAGHEVRCLDLAVDRLDEDSVRWAGLVGISVPMHTATRLGARLARWVRAVNPTAHLTFYGLYASLHADVLVGPPDDPERLGDSAIGGEFEGPLVALAAVLDHAEQSALSDQPSAIGGQSSAIGDVPPPSSRAPRPDRLPPTAYRLPVPPVAGVRTAGHDGGVFLGRQAFRLPRRDLLPPLERYAHVDLGDRQKVAGYVEASRGCAHRCLHCPITPVYQGRLRVVERDVVLEDVAQLVELGAEHVTFGDPDFFNGIRHSLRIVEALHDAFPALTYDVTIKVEHLLEHRQHLPTLARTGCLFVVSAVEAVHDSILEVFQKGHTAADVDRALALTAEVGLPLRPTFVPFTPWTSLEQYLDLLAFVRARGLVRHVDPVQYAIRLLVPRGSSLLDAPALWPYLSAGSRQPTPESPRAPVLGRGLPGFDPESFSYSWTHPDPRMDALQRAVAALVEEAARSHEEPELTLARIERLALAAAGRALPGGSASDDELPALPAAAFVPRLTETWFC